MQKDFKDDTWKMFNNECNGKKVFLFGFCQLSIDIIRKCEVYDCSWDIEAILDNDRSKWGQSVELAGEFYIWNSCDVKSLQNNRKIAKKIYIKNPEELRNYDSDKIIVLICSSHSGEIAKYLETIRVKNYFSAVWLSTKERIFYQQQISGDVVREIENLLCDNRSKQVFSSIIEKRRLGFMDYTDIREWNSSEYFRDEFWAPDKDGLDVFVDGGAYDGDTIEEFENWTSQNYKHVYSFEPQHSKAKIIRKKIIGNKRVSFFEKGLWSSEGKIGFSNGDSDWSGRISANADEYIETVALDEIVNEKVTFLKMDIEGAEIEALKGAKRIIKEDKPYLAVCIYHKLNDLFEIPLLIHEMVPEYKMYIRHMGNRCYGTILYAKL